MVEIGEAAAGDSRICRAVLDDLPEWFGLADAKAGYVAAVAAMPMIVASEGGEALGFLALKRHNAATAEVYVMGVRRAWHGRGVGTRLVEAAAASASGEGLRFLTVKTVAAASPDPHYAATRRFYERRGFVALEVFPTLWLPSNPCLFMARVLPAP